MNTGRALAMLSLAVMAPGSRPTVLGVGASPANLYRAAFFRQRLAHFTLKTPPVTRVSV